MVLADTPIPLGTLLHHAPYWTLHARPLVYVAVISEAKIVLRVLQLSPQETQSGTTSFSCNWYPLLVVNDSQFKSIQISLTHFMSDNLQI
jgi:hypothetical protein